MNLVSRCQDLLASLWKRTSVKAALLLVLGIFVFVQATPVLAQQGTVGQAVDGSEFSRIMAGTTSFSCGANVPTCLLQVVSFIVTFIFSIISYFLSKLLVLLTSILITFARYNSFNNAPPVEIGWVIVRDICNMFFIIVLLVSAFATIIGKGEDLGMHYSNVIKKLLVAAVLVNFSRTIVLLLIDVSQVFTLTFVSAFEGTIAGNLIQGLGIGQMLQLQEQNAAAGAQGGQQVIDVVGIGMAYLLSIFLLVTAVAIVLLYVGYFIVRIIALWMLIIASPFAFLADALPGSMKSALPKQASGFWQQLSAHLTGGPLIAFWLWLSFATIQQTAASGGFATANIGFDFPQDGTANQVLGFVTRIGTAPQLAGFIVAVAMLGMGFKAATDTASSVAGGLLAGVAKRVEGYRDKAFSALARSPYTAVKTVGRGAFNIADRKYGISSRVGAGIAAGRAGTAGQGALATAGGYVGDALRVLPGVGGALATGAAGTLAARRAGLIGADKKKVDERMGDISKMPPEERVKALRGLNDGGKMDNLVGGVSLLERQHEELGKEENRKVLQKQYEKEAAENIKADAAARGVTISDKEADRQAKAVATKRVADEEADRIKRLEKFAEDARDTVRSESLKKEKEKKMLHTNSADYDKQVKAIVDDPTKAKDLDASVLNSGKFALSLMQRVGATDASATSITNTRQLEALKEKYKDNKELVATIDLMAKQIEGGGRTVAELQASTKQTGEYDEARLYSSAGMGGVMYSAPEQAAIAALASGAGRAFGAPLNAAQISALEQAKSAGLPMKMINAKMDQVNASGQSDGMVISAYADMAHRIGATASASMANAVKALDQISETMKVASTLGANQEQLAKVVNAAVQDRATIDAIFGNYNKLAGEQKKQAQAIIEELAKQENEIQAKINAGTALTSLSAHEQNIMSQMSYIKTEVFPPDKIARGAVLPSGGTATRDIGAAPQAIKNVLH